MIKKFVKNLPTTDVLKLESSYYTKAEVDALILGAVEEARRIDEASMAKHNRDATVISMILGFTALALFVDGLLRVLGIVPPFMHLDVNVIDNVVSKVCLLYTSPSPRD